MKREFLAPNLTKLIAFAVAFATLVGVAVPVYGSEMANNGLFDDLDAERARLVQNSSYMTGDRTENLMSDVEKLTTMAAGLVGNPNGTTLSDLFAIDQIDETAEKYGIQKGNNYTWETWAANSDDNKAVYGNLLVLTVAEEARKYMETMGEEDEYQFSSAGNLVLEFASIYAYAATNDAFSGTFDRYLEQLTDGTIEDASSGNKWYTDLTSAADNAGYGAYEESNEFSTDRLAFLNILSALADLPSEQISMITADLTNKNLFSDGAVSEIYDKYLEKVRALSNSYSSGGDSNWSGYTKGDINITAGYTAGGDSIYADLYNVNIRWETTGSLTYSTGTTTIQWDAENLRWDTDGASVSNDGWSGEATVSVTVINRSTKTVDAKVSGIAKYGLEITSERTCTVGTANQGNGVSDANADIDEVFNMKVSVPEDTSQMSAPDTSAVQKGMVTVATITVTLTKTPENGD